MAARFDSGLEPAPQDFPEVTQHQQGYGHQQHSYPEPYQQQPYYQQHYDPPKPEPPFPPSTTYGSQTAASPYSAQAQPATPPSQPETATPRIICGVSLPVFILSCIVAVLSAAVIGLAAATGVESQRASNAASSLVAMSASMTSALAGAATATPTGTAGIIDDGCSADPDAVDRTIYTSFSLLGALKFTRYCNKDAPNAPLLSLFTANFATCMDACAAYTKYIPTHFDNTPNATCEAVSFIPAWTSKVTADAGGAPGNCYLKGGPQNETGLETPNIGVDCHAAVLTRGA